MKGNSLIDPRSCLQPSNPSLNTSLSNLRTNKNSRERREHEVFKQLLQITPGLEERLMTGSEEEVLHICDLVCPIFS